MAKIEEIVARLVAAGWPEDRARDIAKTLTEGYDTRFSKQTRVMRSGGAMSPWEFLGCAVAVSVSLIVLTIAIVVVIAAARSLGRMRRGPSENHPAHRAGKPDLRIVD